MLYKFFDQKTSAMPADKFAGSGIKNENMSDQQLAEELHKPIARKVMKRKVCSPFKDNICDVDLAHIQLTCKFSKEIKFLLCIIDIYSKYGLVIPLKDKKVITTRNAFQKMLDLIKLQTE